MLIKVNFIRILLIPFPYFACTSKKKKNNNKSTLHLRRYSLDVEVLEMYFDSLVVARVEKVMTFRIPRIQSWKIRTRERSPCFSSRRRRRHRRCRRRRTIRVRTVVLEGARQYR